MFIKAEGDRLKWRREPSNCMTAKLSLLEVVDFHLEHRGQGCGRLRNIAFGSEDLALCLLNCRGVSFEGEGDLATARGRS